MNQKRYFFLLLYILCCSVHLLGQKLTQAKDLDPPPPPACGGAVGINLNGEGFFGSGASNVPLVDPGYESDYSYSSTLPLAAGSYTLANSTANWPTPFLEPSWIEISDNSPIPDGYMMVINGLEDNATFVEWQVEGLCPGITYEFAADFINLNDSTISIQGLPEIEFLTNNQVLGSTGELAQDETWHSFGFTFTPDAVQTTLTITLRNNTSASAGNDLAIDNVQFRPCGPSLILEEVLPQAHCVNDLVEIALGIGAGPSDPVVQWQVSQDEGTNWQNFGTPSSSTSLLINNLPENLALRALVAEDIEKIDRPSCRYISSTLSFEYLPILDCPTTVIDTSLCANQTIQVGTEIFANTGSYQVLLQNENGGDSLVELNLSIQEPIIVEQNIGLCQGDIYEGVTYLQDTSWSTLAPALNGCDSLTLFNIILFEGPRPQINGPASICEGNVDQLVTSGSFVDYEWSTGGAGPSLSINQAGTYGLTVTDDAGCIGEDSWDVLPTIIDAQYTITPPTCAVSADGILQIESITGGSGNYQVRLDGKVIPEASVAVPTGTFSLQIEDSKGCSFEENISILPLAPLQLEYEASYQIYSGQHAQLSIAGNRPLTQVRWAAQDSLSCIDCFEPMASPAYTTRYEVTAEDDRGCTATAEITVIVKQQFAVYAPNVFSPNGDGFNDYFSLYGGEELSQINELNIYNRWGNLVYTQRAVAIGSQSWDGSFEGLALPEGVYIFQAEITGTNGRTESLTGEVTLIR